MSTILVYPGQVSDPVSLQAVLREKHEAERAETEKEVALRKARGVPLDDTTTWSSVRDELARLTSAVAVGDGLKTEAAARAIVGAVDGNTMTVPDAYVDDPDIEGVVVSFTMVSDAQRRDWSARLAVQFRGLREARLTGDEGGYARALDGLEKISSEQIVAVVATIAGVEGLKGTIAESIGGIALSPLFNPLVHAVRYFLKLPAGKALRCGRLAPST